MGLMTLVKIKIFYFLKHFCVQMFHKSIRIKTNNQIKSSERYDMLSSVSNETILTI